MCIRDRIQGQALHSHTLDIIHPISNKKMHFEADIPEDFLNCIEFAKQYRLKKGI